MPSRMSGGESRVGFVANNRAERTDARDGRIDIHAAVLHENFDSQDIAGRAEIGTALYQFLTVDGCSLAHVEIAFHLTQFDAIAVAKIHDRVDFLHAHSLQRLT